MTGFFWTKCKGIQNNKCNKMEKILFTSILEESTVGVWENYFDKPLWLRIKPPKDAQVTKDSHSTALEGGWVLLLGESFVLLNSVSSLVSQCRSPGGGGRSERRGSRVAGCGRERIWEREETQKRNAKVFIAKVGGWGTMFVYLVITKSWNISKSRQNNIMNPQVPMANFFFICIFNVLPPL